MLPRTKYTQAKGLKTNGRASQGVWVLNLILIFKHLIIRIREHGWKFVLGISRSSNSKS
jgi:hypothetical protein